MNTDIEALLLSGELLDGDRHSSSPERRSSPDSGWHDDQLSLVGHAQCYTQDQPDSIGMGPGRTGVKGVIRDHDESERLEREKRNKEVRELQQRMKSTNLGGKTFLEEEREKGLDEKLDLLVRREREETAQRKMLFIPPQEGHFGYLREVGVNGFLAAVENGEPGVWVVIHIYDAFLERCYSLDNTLARLARLYPDTKFLRARASTLGFTSRKPTQQFSSEVGHQSDDAADKEYADVDVDLDMLPTVLVYRDGELVQNWIRVDWEAGHAGIEELFKRHQILTHSKAAIRGSRVSSSDEDADDIDIIWSSDEDVHK